LRQLRLLASLLVTNLAAESGRPSSQALRRTAHWTGFLVGVALIGGLDEIVFHQLLQWHHFYLHTTEFWRTVSDGLFHAFTTGIWFVGTVLLWYQRHRLAKVIGQHLFWAGLLFGMGAFQLFDGTVSHKLIQIHPVRTGVDVIWPYDAAWIASGLLLLAQGWLLRRTGMRRIESG
jgi:uncharacterized membrane protein